MGIEGARYGVGMWVWAGGRAGGRGWVGLGVRGVYISVLDLISIRFNVTLIKASISTSIS